MNVFDYQKVKDPRYFRDGRLDAHSDHRYYASAQEADEKESRFTESLNGLRKFHYARNYGSAIPGFESADYDCRSWEDIRVPAHIQMEGYDVPQYANTQYPWEGHEEIQPGEIPENFNPVASYVKYFEVPEHMKDRRLFISFQGAENTAHPKGAPYAWAVSPFQGEPFIYASGVAAPGAFLSYSACKEVIQAGTNPEVQVCF